ncbi:hypothetical protein BD309DRAFT_1024323 [Dichomitus squalens]|nr:hypothetical protein BD309DRAFT_1024323 [Dichomitus squalens]
MCSAGSDPSLTQVRPLVIYISVSRHTSSAFSLRPASSLNPMYYTGFSTATIVASITLFQGLNTDDLANSLSLLAGCITTSMGCTSRSSPAPPSGGGDASELGYIRASEHAEEEVGLQMMYEPESDN